jgi:glycosyltransferase involved in cell wall biosynthesis
MNTILLTVSGVMDPDVEGMIARGERPRTDYIAMAQAFGADLMDYAAARRSTGWVGKWLEKLGGRNLTLAWACFRCRKQYRVIFTDGEQVGIPLALLLKFASSNPRPRHLMIAHVLSTGKKRPFFDWLGVQSDVDIFFVYASWQKQFIETHWKIAPERVILMPFMVDANFFKPSQVRSTHAMADLNGQRKPVICAVGLECRDYPTLMAAVQGLDVQVVVAAASPWSKWANTAAKQILPENVMLRKLSLFELRQLYAMSQFVVVPLLNVNFQAGVTTILEAMAMEKAVICSRTVGQTDIVVEGETGLYVPPGDPAALRAAVVSLLRNPSRAEEMGKKGRLHVEQAMNLDRYVARLKRVVRQASVS